jgi:sodium transport system permease protein
MIDRIAVVFRKEMLDNLRDWRSWSAALVSPLIGPLLLIALIVFQGQSRAEQFDRPLELPIVGVERAPNLVAFLEQQNVTVQPPPADPEAAVRASDADVILVIPEDYAQDFREGRPATVQLIADTSRQAVDVTIQRTRNTLEAYSRQIGVLRLQARGVSPSVTEALALETVDVATPQARAGFLLRRRNGDDSWFCALVDVCAAGEFYRHPRQSRPVRICCRAADDDTGCAFGISAANGAGDVHEKRP